MQCETALLGKRAVHRYWACSAEGGDVEVWLLVRLGYARNPMTTRITTITTTGITFDSPKERFSPYDTGTLLSCC